MFRKSIFLALLFYFSRILHKAWPNSRSRRKLWYEWKVHKFSKRVWPISIFINNVYLMLQKLLLTWMLKMWNHSWLPDKYKFHCLANSHLPKSKCWHIRWLLIWYFGHWQGFGNDFHRRWWYWHFQRFLDLQDNHWPENSTKIKHFNFGAKIQIGTCLSHLMWGVSWDLTEHESLPDWPICNDEFLGEIPVTTTEAPEAGEESIEAKRPKLLTSRE